MEEFYSSLNLESVVISGGGAYGITMLELLETLQTQNAFKHVNHWCGTSVGSICALCMNIGVTMDEIRPLLQSIKDQFKITPQTLIQVPDTYGFISHTPFKQLIATVLERHGILPKVTFSQLYRITGQNLTITACCLDRNTTIHFHHETFPDVSIIDAVMASCSIPIVFPIYTIKGQRYIDGGFLTDWSFDPSKINPKTALLICAKCVSNDIPPTITSFMDYVQYLMNQSMRNLERLTDDMIRLKSSFANIIQIPFESHAFDLSYITETKDVIQQRIQKIIS